MRVLVLVIALGFHVSAGIASAEVTPEPCDCYALTAWTTDNGLPTGSVLAITQALDRYLWLGTTNGLVRFDGAHFTRWGAQGEPALAGLFISDLLASGDGALWVAFGDVGGVTRIDKDGRVRHYGEQDGLSAGPVWTLLEDRHGFVWVGGRQGVIKFRDGQWTRIGQELGLPAAEVSSLYQDASGRLWVATSVGVFRGSSEGDRFELYDDDLRLVQDIEQDDEGTMWITDERRLVKTLAKGRWPTLMPNVSLPVGGLRLLGDGQGSVWIAALGSGLLRLRQDASGEDVIERFDYEHKFARGAAGGVRSLFIDDEQNVWVGMRAGGLLRITRTPFDTRTSVAGLTSDGVRAIAAGADGSVWVATGRRVNRFTARGREVYDVPQAMAIHAGDSDVWVATATGLSRFVQDHFTHVPLAGRAVLTRLSSMTGDSRGHLWLCGTGGLSRWEGDASLRPVDTDAARKPCRTVLSDCQGRLWAGFGDGSLAMRDGRGWHLYGTADGLAPGEVMRVYEDSKGATWVATRGGLSLFKNDHFETLAVGSHLPDGITALLLEDRQGYLWLGVASGSAVVRFTRRHFEAAVVTKSPMPYDLYDQTDGLNGQLLRTSNPSGVMSADGRLWVLSGSGVVIVNPASLPGAHVVSAPRIERVLADGVRFALDDGVSLPAGTSTLDLNFTSVSPSSASKLKFRYALDGVDRAWVDAGRQRNVAYSNLRPGRHLFRVQAVSEGGTTTRESTWSFVVEPYVYQTRWFSALVVSACLLTIYGLWQLRLRRVRHEYELVAAERTRLGREIHDNILQSFAAVGWELEVLASECDVRAADTPSAPLRRLATQVRRCIHEARRSIWELRSPGLNGGDLANAIREFAQTASAGSGSTVSVKVQGLRRRCSPATEEQLLLIAMEAIRNATRHAAARQITVTLEYGAEAVTLTVHDDGQGFVRNHGDGEWHWGLKSMEERATRMRGQLAVTSELGRGTVVEVAAPL